MAVRSKYQKSGSFILFKKLEQDPLGELWRTARIVNGEIGELCAVRRLTGVDKTAVAAALRRGQSLTPHLNGSTLAKGQTFDVVETVPTISWEYAGGRSLRYVIDRARNTAAPNPVPLDQIIAVVDKIAASLETINVVRFGESMLLHGALLPQFVWVTDDGEIRVAAQSLGPSFVASLAKPELAKSIGGFFAPEYRSSATPSKASDVFSTGAILYMLLTGRDPLDTNDRAAFDAALARPTMMGTSDPVPSDIAPILKRAYAWDVADRYPSFAELRRDLGKLLASGRYASTTFNLAFYLHSLLKKDMETEALERERETKVTLDQFADEPEGAVPVAAPAMFQQQIDEQKNKSRTGFYVAAAAIVLVAAGAAFYFLKPAPKPEATVAAVVPAAEPLPPPVEQPVVATTTGSVATDSAAVTDTNAPLSPEEMKKRAIEEAINKRLQEELLKLQAEADRAMRARAATSAPALAASTTPPANAAESRVEQPAAVVEQRPATQPAAQPVAQPPQSQPQTPPPTQPQPQPAVAVAQQEPAPPPAPAGVKEGDIVEYSALDQTPRSIRKVPPQYPPVAAKQKITATVYVSALISESGTVVDVRLLRPDNRRYGFNEAAMKAARAFTFSPAVKDGKRVKTWAPIPFEFKVK